jgi:cation diffusion facilitator CzcD-associated flavoprotein CzcO
MSGLAKLQEEVKQSLRYLGDDPANWVPPRAGIDHDVTVVGGGQSGVTIAFALRRAGVANVTVVEAAPEGKAGTWVTKARMRTLRTAKRITGPELGIPALSFPAWYEAQHGAEAYAKMGLIPLEDWAAYVAWYRDTVGVKVRYDTRLERIEPIDGGFKLTLSHHGETRMETTRKVILATGGVGSGTPSIPASIAAALPANKFAHTDATIDFAALRGKRVGVVGAAASAFDAAGVALEAGAKEVHLFCRDTDLARAAPARALGYPGAANNFCHMDDADRWRLGRVLRGRSPGPPPDTVRRATRFDNFHLHMNAPATDVTMENDAIAFNANGERFALDFLVLGTGYRVDACARPELGPISDKIAAWGDRYTPPPGQQDSYAARYPYMGDGFEFKEKTPGTAPYVRNIHSFTFGAIESFGRHIGDNGSLAAGVPRLVAAVSRDLFLDDRDHHMARLTAPAPLELTGEEYRHSVWSAPATATVK